MLLLVHVSEYFSQVRVCGIPVSLAGEADEVHGVLNELCRRIDDESSRNGLLTGDQDADEATVQVLAPAGHHSTST